MNNKRGGFGTKVLAVLILMIISAAGGAYAYRILDGKLAVSDAKKYVDSIRVSDYDTEEAVQIETFKETATQDLETAKTRKEAYEILDAFKENVSGVMTKTEKELEEARQAVQNANNNNNNNNNNGNTTDPTGNTTDDTDTDSGSGGILNNLFGGDTTNNTDDDSDSGDIFN